MKIYPRQKYIGTKFHYILDSDCVYTVEEYKDGKYQIGWFNTFRSKFESFGISEEHLVSYLNDNGRYPILK